jgi:CPA1 family monovalent cation:H+ antiporter
MAFNGLLRWHDRVFGFTPTRLMLRPTIGSGLVIAWAGMRGIVSLAAALALPTGFPHRDLIVFTAFSIVLGTLIVQGLTLKPLLRMLNLEDDDPVGRERRAARARALEAGLAAIARAESPHADAVRREFSAHLASEEDAVDGTVEVRSEHTRLHRDALKAAREAVLAMRSGDQIGDDAFHEIEEELDWLEMADGRNEE